MGVAGSTGLTGLAGATSHVEANSLAFLASASQGLELTENHAVASAGCFPVSLGCGRSAPFAASTDTGTRTGGTTAGAGGVATLTGFFSSTAAIAGGFAGGGTDCVANSGVSSASTSSCCFSLVGDQGSRF